MVFAQSCHLVSFGTLGASILALCVLARILWRRIFGNPILKVVPALLVSRSFRAECLVWVWSCGAWISSIWYKKFCEHQLFTEVRILTLPWSIVGDFGLRRDQFSLLSMLLSWVFNSMPFDAYPETLPDLGHCDVINWPIMRLIKRICH